MEKNNKNLNVPNLRFPEFSGEWEKVPLSKIATRVTRKNKNNESRLPLTISAQYGLVDQVTFFNKVVASSDMSNYYLLHKGEFAYNKSYSGDYRWGAIKRLDRYDQGALSSLYICFTPTDVIDSDFLVHYFESPKWHREVSNIAGEGARNHGLLNIAVPDFFNTQHCITTNKTEQRKIAEFLNLINERIETQKKVIEDFKKLKDAISKLLFRHRAGNEYTIGELCKSIAVKQYISIDVAIDGTYPIIQQGESPVAGYTESDPFFDYEKVILFGDHTLSIYRPNVPFLLSTDGIKILRPNDLVLRDYLYYLLYAFMPRSEGYKRHYSILKDICVPVPDIDTQKSIVEELLSVDSKIEIEVRVLKLQIQQKEYCLNQMFI